MKDKTKLVLNFLTVKQCAKETKQNICVTWQTIICFLSDQREKTVFYLQTIQSSAAENSETVTSLFHHKSFNSPNCWRDSFSVFLKWLISPQPSVLHIFAGEEKQKQFNQDPQGAKTGRKHCHICVPSYRQMQWGVNLQTCILRCLAQWSY